MSDLSHEAKSITSYAVVANFIREYFTGTEGRVWISAIRNRNSKLRNGEIDKLMTRKPRAIAEFVSKHDDPKKDCAIYFCTATIKAGATKRNDKTCWEFPSLFADVDDKHHDLTRAEAIERIEALECPPTIIVDSGHGLQPAWLLSEASEDAKRVIAAREKLHDLVASDSVADAPRFMRLPGSHNSKEGDWLPVKIISYHPERRYALEVLEDWLDRAEVVIPAKQKAKTNGAANSTPFVLPPSIKTDNASLDHRRGNAWARRALEESARELANAGEGSRHNFLRDKSVRMATMIARGWIDIQEVKRALLAGSEACGQIKDYGIGHFEETFAAGIKYGLALPHADLPNDEYTQHTHTNGPGLDNAAAANSVPPPASEDKDFRALSKEEFVSGFVAPDYLLDGILQRRFIYSLTAQTGHGKTALALVIARLIGGSDPKAALGRHGAEKGQVVYFAGENPDDLRMRVLGDEYLCNDDKARIYFIPGTFSIEAMRAKIEVEMKRLGGVDLVVIDTSAAYFNGKDELSNTEMGAHARLLRTLTTLLGGPCVLVLCHPVKHVTDPSQLLPRGGGAFLAEVDGNLTPWKHDGVLLDLHHTDKLRGPGFEPINLRLETLTTTRLMDQKGRLIPTVRAVWISDTETARETEDARSDEDALIKAMLMPGQSIADLADACGWRTSAGEPYKSKVQRVLKRLEKDKLVITKRGLATLTEAGKAAANAATTRRATRDKNDRRYPS